MGPCFRRDDKRGYHLHVSNSPTSSLPGLTRQSILFESALLEDGWMPGSSPGTTSPLSTQLRDLAACFARVLPENSCPLKPEGAGNTGRPMRPIAACALVESKSTRVSQVTPESPGIPRAMVYGLYRALPGEPGFLATVAPEKLASQELDTSVGVSGTHDFAVRIKRRSSSAHPRPPHPAPRP